MPRGQECPGQVSPKHPGSEVTPGSAGLGLARLGRGFCRRFERGCGFALGLGVLQHPGQALNALNAHLHKSAPDPAPFDLNALVREVMASKKQWQHRFRPSLELEAGLPPVLGHRLQTEKVLANLIQNGLDAMGEARLPASDFVVSVATRSDGRTAQVTVRDNGPGLHAKTAQTLFQPFFTTKPHGLGLGLSICRTLIGAEHGRLWFDPEEHPGAEAFLAATGPDTRGCAIVDLRMPGMDGVPLQAEMARRGGFPDQAGERQRVAAERGRGAGPGAGPA